MNDLNIFDSAAPQAGEFFKFKEVGDSLQGTYIDARKGTDSFGNAQTIYVIQDSDGKIWNAGFRDTQVFIHERMNNIRFGQIIGYRFDENRESKKKPGTMAKIIRVYADPKFVNQEWLNSRKELEEKFGEAPVATPVAQTADVPFESNHFEKNDGMPSINMDPFSIPVDASPVSGAFPTDSAVSGNEQPKNDALDAVRQLALTKGITHQAMTPIEADAAIEGFAEMELNDENLTKIIIKITSAK